MAFKKARRPKQGEKKRLKIQALFWLDPPVAARIKKLAERHEISQSELVRTVFEYLENEELWERLAKAAKPVNKAAAAASEAA